MSRLPRIVQETREARIRSGLNDADGPGLLGVAIRGGDYLVTVVKYKHGSASAEVRLIAGPLSQTGAIRFLEQFYTVPN